MTLITGNTYPVKDQLKALGGKWDSAAKGWRVPDEKADEAIKLVGKSAGRPRSSYQPRICKTCGCRINYGVYCGKCEFSY